MKTIGTLFAAALLLQGCASVKSDISYTKGMDKLYEGDIDQAIVHLRQAVELDPTVARNHHQLALAYQRLGDLPKAWQEARHAYAIDSRSPTHLQVFTRLYNQISEKHLIERKHPSAAEVIDYLGVADKYIHDENGDLKAVYYGPLCLRFDQGRLSTSEWYTPHNPVHTLR